MTDPATHAAITPPLLTPLYTAEYWELMLVLTIIVQVYIVTGGFKPCRYRVAGGFKSCRYQDKKG